MRKRTAYIALNALTGMTPRVFWRLIHGEPDPVRVFSRPRETLIKLGVSEEMARRIRQADPEPFVREEKKRLAAVGARILIYGDQEYPPTLREIADPPPVLYLHGEIRKEDRLALAVVGSRSASTQGRLQAERIAARLAGMGLTIVSGLAMGIDTWAHKGALSGGGRTLAVLGCGIDYPYPRHNRKLRDRIVKQGALISEFALGTPPIPMNFPRRNRIISGLSMGTLVVEAARKSGSLITAGFALEQGREVFAFPGSVHSPLSAGTNTLIQKGAKLVQRVEDIVEEFPAEVKQYLSFQPRQSPSRPARESREELRLLRLIEEDPVHIDVLSRKTKMAPAVVSSLLMEMEIKGLVRQLPGQLYTRPESG